MSGSHNLLSSYKTASGGGNGLLTGLVSYWTSDDADISGATLLDVHGANDGTIVGATSGFTGIIGECLDYAGFNVSGMEYVDFGDINALEGIGAITISLWAKRDSSVVSDSAGDALIGKFQGGQSWLMWQTKSPDATRFRVRIGATNYDAISTSTGLDTDWHHYVGRYDGSEVSLWIDGVKQSTAPSATGNINTANGLVQLGTYQRNNDWWDGLIDEIGAWSVALTDTQIGQLYNSGSGLAYSSFTS